MFSTIETIISFRFTWFQDHTKIFYFWTLLNHLIYQTSQRITPTRKKKLQKALLAIQYRGFTFKWSAMIRTERIEVLVSSSGFRAIAMAFFSIITTHWPYCWLFRSCGIFFKRASNSVSLISVTGSKEKKETIFTKSCYQSVNENIIKSVSR